jgi:hypothetical protein
MIIPPVRPDARLFGSINPWSLASCLAPLTHLTFDTSFNHPLVAGVLPDTLFYPKYRTGVNRPYDL